MTEYMNYDIHAKLIELIRTEFTGSLTTAPEKRKLFFESGDLVYANSEIDGESFADILTEMHVLAPKVLEELKQHAQAGLSLGKKIRDEGLATPQDLAMALKQQIMRVVSRVVNQPFGSYEIVVGSLPAKIPTLRIFTLPLFVKSFLLVDDPDFPNAIHEGLTLQLSHQFEKLRDKLNLPIAYLDAINQIGDSATVEQIAIQSELDLNQAKRLAYTLAMLGAANLVAQEAVVDLSDVVENDGEVLEMSALLDDLDSASTIPDQGDMRSLEDTVFGRLPVTAQDLLDQAQVEPIDDEVVDLAEPKNVIEPIQVVVEDPVIALNRVLSDSDEDELDVPSMSLIDDGEQAETDGQPMSLTDGIDDGELDPQSMGLIDDSETVPARPMEELLAAGRINQGPYDDYDAADLMVEDNAATAPMAVVHASDQADAENASSVDLRDRGFILPEPSESEPIIAKQRGSKVPAIVGTFVIVAALAAGWYFRAELMRYIPAFSDNVDPPSEVAVDGPLDEALPNDNTAEVQDLAQEDLTKTDQGDIGSSALEANTAFEPDDAEPDDATTPPAIQTKSTRDSEAPVESRPATPFSRYQERAQRNAAELSGSSKRYSVAFTVACEMSTLDAAFQSLTDDSQLRILPRKIGSRDCFIAMWGLYSSREEAEAAAARVPRSLVSSSDPPWIIHLDQYL